MNILFTPHDASVVIGVISTLVLPFAVSWMKRGHWSDWQKWALAAALSVAAGALSAYADGKLNQPMTVVEAASLILTTSSAHYHTWFKGLGLEDWMNPPADEIVFTPDRD